MKIGYLWQKVESMLWRFDLCAVCVRQLTLAGLVTARTLGRATVTLLCARVTGSLYARCARALGDLRERNKFKEFELNLLTHLWKSVQYGSTKSSSCNLGLKSRMLYYSRGTVSGEKKKWSKKRQKPTTAAPPHMSRRKRKIYFVLLGCVKAFDHYNYRNLFDQTVRPQKVKLEFEQATVLWVGHIRSRLAVTSPLTRQFACIKCGGVCYTRDSVRVESVFKYTHRNYCTSSSHFATPLKNPSPQAYSSESWIWQKQNESRIDVEEMRFLHDTQKLAKVARGRRVESQLKIIRGLGDAPFSEGRRVRRPDLHTGVASVQGIAADAVTPIA
ncbi:hypothetical protein EVAR_38769_1 [Eumeta japonica]|uniref:Uncharacterized protein n=1 Tax=Eumeta variegata TaxID=151549 RepID=A0A4C1WML1_EUMVA|nr:hypothetical protein EVAR_38769_1 [Eumeta japonica]